ncbi:MAG: hypothetical protein Q9222_006118 [Ikaeria aurantiellina]
MVDGARNNMTWSIISDIAHTVLDTCTALPGGPGGWSKYADVYIIVASENSAVSVQGSASKKHSNLSPMAVPTSSSNAPAPTGTGFRVSGGNEVSWFYGSFWASSTRSFQATCMCQSANEQYKRYYSNRPYGDEDPDAVDDSRSQIQAQLREFILEFRLDNAFIYRDQIRENVLMKQYYCDVDIAHLISYNEELAHKLQTQPADTIPLFEAALKQCTHRIVYPSQRADELRLPQHQLLLHSSASIISIRDLNATNISHLVRIPGIVIGASTLSSKATLLSIQCRNCQQLDSVPVTGGIAAVSLPRVCSRKRTPGDDSDKCPLDPYFVVHEKCQFIDQQILKLQEAPDQVPVGELPRHIKISADRYLTNRVVPGTRCTITGVFSIYQNKEAKSSTNNSAVAIRTPYLRAVGISTDIDHTAKGTATFSEEEEQEFLELSRRPDLYNVFANCIAPSIYGNQDIKKAIACLLLGGSKKILPDGMKLRGDINVLLLGDPGTAKSQLDPRRRVSRRACNGIPIPGNSI